MVRRANIIMFSIWLLILVACAGVTVNQENLIHDLAWDAGYLGYTFSPRAQAYLDTGCAAFAVMDTTGSQYAKQALSGLIGHLWTEANDPRGVALVLVLNNLSGLLGLDKPLNQVMTLEETTRIREAAAAMCDGVKQAKTIMGKL